MIWPIDRALTTSMRLRRAFSASLWRALDALAGRNMSVVLPVVRDHRANGRLIDGRLWALQG